jgi:hypothetical protein
VLGMATRDEVARLQQRVRALEQEVERASKASAAPKATGPATRAGKAAPAATPSTRTRTGGASSRSTASSPGTRRPRSAKPKPAGDDGG